MDKTNKFVASLNYFSVFFAPFLLPIAIYFIADHHEVKEHAKKALISHIVPFLSIVGLIIIGLFSMFSNPTEATFFTVFFIGMVLAGLINLIVVIWNIVKGIKLLMSV
ncbi:hypothetical protein A9C19_02055 [Bacillus weihaiensis]|uniref:DUF4870 domain-containing protein n=2 Tax=Bacillus weihaiensis TaxID=1547283 RepID=A0A1L3MX43_9BACI|nr:hypothetical protein A9C19_02055 [Bacillus weihaiensis]